MLQKQSVDIRFAKGVDTKTDPWQVPIGGFLELVNMSFATGGRLSKRYGYGTLPSLSEIPSFITTFNGNLTAVGSNLQALSSGTGKWYNKGDLQPVELSVLPLIRSTTNQFQLDTAVSSNGLVCTVYTDQNTASLSNKVYKYAIADATTGQNIIEPTAIPVTSGTVTGSPRVFLLGPYFIIVFTNLITATNHLQYIAISVNNPTMVTANTDIVSSYDPASTLSWDGATAGSNLYIAYNTSSGGQAIGITYLSSTLVVATPVTYSNLGKVTATIMSVCADATTQNPTIYASYYDSGSSTGFTVAVNSALHKVISTPAEIISSGTILNLTSAAANGQVTVYYEVSNAYSYDSSIPTNYIDSVTCTSGGSVGTPGTVARSVGLASKAFILNSTKYFLAAYQSTYQPTYFLLNGSGQVISRLAYSNGGGYCTLGLPSVTLTGDVAQIGYLFKDFITSQNTSATESVTKSNIYSQTGLNLASFTIGTSAISSAEIGQSLFLTGGFLWQYDGYVPVESNFFLWPDSVEGTPANTTGSMVPQEYQYQVIYSWTDNQGIPQYSAPSIPIIVDMSTNNKSFTQPTALTPTATLTSGSNVLTAVSSFTGIAIGQVVSDTTTAGHIQTGSYITAFDSGASTITLSLPVTASAVGDSLSITSRCKVTLHVPTLRLTYKINSPIKIQIYRWSTSQQEFFETTSISTPLLNDTTVDSVSFVDTKADNQILGNSLIYTTGGVIENIAPPSLNAITLFDNRLWGINAEDPNSLGFSKQVIEGTTVEMSDLFTKYVSPSIGSQGSTGLMKCLFPLDDKLIIFKPNALYYMNGSGPDNTGANDQYSQPIFITSVVGSSNQQSIVFIPNGLMFQSETAEVNGRVVTNGIWILDRGLGVSYIGSPVEKYTSVGRVQSAVSIPGTTQVRFTLSSGVTLMYDYFYQQWGTFLGVPAISSTLYNNLHTFVNSRGEVYQETPGSYLDGSTPVVMSFKTSWINLAGLQGYQRASHFYMLGRYISPHFLNLNIAYDYSDSPSQQVLITPNNYSQNYGYPSPYGQGSPYGGPGDVEMWRVFLNKQRCQSVQLQLQEIYDPSLGVKAGAGLTMSGVNMMISVVRSYRSAGSKSTAASTGGGNQ